MPRWLLLCLGALACGPGVPTPAPAGGVVLVTDELDAALAILERRAGGQPVTPDLWQRLWDSEGYRRLGQRELAFERPFSDSAFRRFLESDTLLARLPELSRAATEWHRMDPAGPASAAARYLPAHTVIRARLYPLIKPLTNTFVFGGDSVMGIFYYVDPASPEPKVRNTLAHELHHIGYSAACSGEPDSTLTPALRTLAIRLGGFGEGLAMLAAAGGPEVHPHATSDSAERARWDRDIVAIGDGFARLEAYMAEVRNGQIGSPDSVARRAMEFYGVQGPWYTVGWVMATTIERAMGHDYLLRIMCDPVQLMRSYNLAADRLGAAGRNLPRWSRATLETFPPSRAR